jgi:glucosamine--fructose-6-phosphate aminotransferase (isomerizing)
MTPTDTSALTKEALEAADAAERLLKLNGAGFSALGAELRRNPPKFVVTCARGSSDHASLYGKYLIETVLGIPVASIGPSVASLYDAALKLDGALFIAVSQSGRSPDLLRLSETAKAAGARVVGFVNDETSPLVDLCTVSLPLRAGPEVSVAATKSFISSCFSYLCLVAHWSGRADLIDACDKLPSVLRAARELDWWPVLSELVEARDMFIIGRGVGFGPALEMALKLKETSRLHAEGFSSAEVSHGPLNLVGPGFPVIALGQDDASAEASRAMVARMVELGAPVWSEIAVEGARALPRLEGVPSVLAPLAAIQGFYMAVARFALARGLDPDRPANLSKVTETI